MQKSVINLYTIPNCPKCKILKENCKSSSVIANSDFRIIEINPNNEADTDLQLLIEHGIASFPVLLVDNVFMNFSEAMQYVRN